MNSTVKALVKDWLFWLCLLAGAVSILAFGTGCSGFKVQVEGGGFNPAPGVLSSAVKAVANATGFDWVGPAIGAIFGATSIGTGVAATKRAHRKGKAEAKAESVSAAPTASTKV